MSKVRFLTFWDNDDIDSKVNEFLTPPYIEFIDLKLVQPIGHSDAAKFILIYRNTDLGVK